MHHFFVDPAQVMGDFIRITGPDVNHMKNALRMKQGEEVLVSDGTGTDYHCCLSSLNSDCVEARIVSADRDGRELPSRIWLFQGLPKSDKMELIIQKAVELGAAGIVPVSTKNAVVKLDAKKEEAKRKRWQAIAESAAKQSGRSLMPRVMGLMTLGQAFDYIEKEQFALRLIPYEHEAGMEGRPQAGKTPYGVERRDPGKEGPAGRRKIGDRPWKYILIIPPRPVCLTVSGTWW